MRASRAVLVWLSFLGLLVVAVAGSACGASQRQDTIKAALITVDVARESWLAYDKHAQAEIVAKATSLEDGRAKLAAYRANQGKIETAFEIAYRAVASAAALNDDPSLAGMKAAIDAATKAVAVATGGTP